MNASGSVAVVMVIGAENDGVALPVLAACATTTGVTSWMICCMVARSTLPRSVISAVSPGASASVVLATSGLDRKSTRLNSSHLGISYAVFCLKKKKNKTLSNLTQRMTSAGTSI